MAASTDGTAHHNVQSHCQADEKSPNLRGPGVDSRTKDHKYQEEDDYISVTRPMLVEMPSPRPGVPIPTAARAAAGTAIFTITAATIPPRHCATM